MKEAIKTQIKVFIYKTQFKVKSAHNSFQDCIINANKNTSVDKATKKENPVLWVATKKETLFYGWPQRNFVLWVQPTQIFHFGKICFFQFANIM